jgi:tRNA pseudouridine32 synthase/23S rRNA pseudouridine746 synthase
MVRGSISCVKGQKQDNTQARIEQSFFSSYWRWQIEADEPYERSIVAELSRRLPHIDPASWPERFALGGVYLAGSGADPTMEISPPCRLEYYEPKVPLESVGAVYPAFRASMVLHHDDDIAVIAKPAGLPTTPARDQLRYNLQEYLTNHFGRPVHMPSRLDTGVAGVVLCSLSSRANRYFQKAFERRWIEKFYIAEVSGLPTWKSALVQRAITRDARHPVLRRCVVGAEVGEAAETRLALLGSVKCEGTCRSLLQAEPLTGRTHQIRIHCQSEGLPIVGDPFYGGLESEGLHLASYMVRFHHPYRNQMMTCELPPIHQPTWLQAASEAVGGITLVSRSS